MLSKCEKIWKKSLKNQKRPEKIRKDLKRPEKIRKDLKNLTKNLSLLDLRPTCVRNTITSSITGRPAKPFSIWEPLTKLSVIFDRLGFMVKGKTFLEIQPRSCRFSLEKGDKQKFTSSELRHSHSINNKNNKTCQNFPPTFPSLVISFTSLEENLSTNKYQIVSFSLKFFIVTLWCICCRYTVSIKPSRKIEDLPIICCQTKTCIFTWTTYQNISDYIKSVIKSWAKKCNYLRRKKHGWIKSLPHALANKNNIAWGQQGKLSIF